MIDDIIIIGAGVVGCAVARELSRYEANIRVLETRSDIAEGASKANSGIVHAGFDAKPGSKKAKYNVLGANMYEELCLELAVPYRRSGAMVVGFNEEDKKTLEKLLQQGIDNGIPHMEIISGDKARELEKELSPDVKYALLVPTSGIVSPYEMTFGLADHAAINGVVFECGKEVVSLKYEDAMWHLDCADGTSYKTKAIVNCAGVFSAKLHNMISPKKYTISPRKGEYYLVDRLKPLLFDRTIFQCPTIMGKGVLVSPTVHGNMLLGPSSTDVEDPLDLSTSMKMLKFVFEKSKLSWANANKRNVITTFAGMRAHELGGDFIIGATEGAEHAYETVGIESPGLSAAPAIAVDLAKEIGEKEGLSTKKEWKAYIKPKKLFNEMSLEEKIQAYKEDKGYGKIICRCEVVTEADIRNAIHRPVGARSVDGVKRRTRAGGGRCQGGFCGPSVMEILAEELNCSILEISKFGNGSKYLFGEIKDFIAREEE